MTQAPASLPEQVLQSPHIHKHSCDDGINPLNSLTTGIPSKSWASCGSAVSEQRTFLSYPYSFRKWVLRDLALLAWRSHQVNPVGEMVLVTLMLLKLPEGCCSPAEADFLDFVTFMWLVCGCLGERAHKHQTWGEFCCCYQLGESQFFTDRHKKLGLHLFFIIIINKQSTNYNWSFKICFLALPNFSSGLIMLLFPTQRKSQPSFMKTWAK